MGFVGEFAFTGLGKFPWVCDLAVADALCGKKLQEAIGFPQIGFYSPTTWAIALAIPLDCELICADYSRYSGMLAVVAEAWHTHTCDPDRPMGESPPAIS